MERSLWLALTLLLCVTNSLTLLDRDFRHGAYKVFARTTSPVLQALGLTKATALIEARSPAMQGKKTIERATLHLVEDSTRLRRKIAELHVEKAALAAESTALLMQLRGSQAQMALYRDRTTKLGTKAIERAGKGVARGLLALPGHAVPLLGATVAVGSATIDINDACDSLKELDELNRTVGLPPLNRTKVCGVVVPTAEELLAAARANWRSVYEKSATALNAGTSVIPRVPPAISLDSMREWVSSTPAR
jgi:hypothetical protein